jgi:hypothetical protein
VKAKKIALAIAYLRMSSAAHVGEDSKKREEIEGAYKPPG